MCDYLCMRTTLDLDEDLLAEARRVTGGPSKTAVVEMGLQELVAAAARRRLAALRGSVRSAAAPRRRRPQRGTGRAGR